VREQMTQEDRGAGTGRQTREAAAERAAIAVRPAEFNHSASGTREKVFELKGVARRRSGTSRWTSAATT
jgi:hypothetical protein